MNHSFGSLRLVAFALLLAWCTPAWAAKPTLLTDTKTIRACEQGERYRVLATEGGLLIEARLSGKTKRLTRLDGLPGTRIDSLLLEGEDAWVGTESGLARVDLVKGKVSEAYDWGTSVRALTRFKGRIHAALWERGLAIEGKSGAFRLPRARGELAETIRARARITSLTRWGSRLVGTTMSRGLIEYQGRQTRELGVLSQVPAWDSLQAKGALYVATSGGLFTYEHSKLRAQGPSHWDVRRLTKKNSKVLITTKASGLKTYDLNQGRFDNRKTNKVSECAKLSHSDSRPELAPHLPVSDISSASHCHGRTFLGGFDQGLFSLGDGRARRILARTVDAKVNTLLCTPTRLLVGTARGLYTLDPQGKLEALFKESSGLPSHNVLSLARDGNDRVLVGTSRGLALLSGDAITPLGKKSGGIESAIWALHSDGSGRTWIGTNRGLFLAKSHRDLLSSRFSRLSTSRHQLEDDWITAITSRGSRVLVGTYAHGVQELAHRDGSWVQVADFGGGYVNLGALSVLETKDGPLVLVGTMRGLLVKQWQAREWEKKKMAAPGIDVTASLRLPGGKFLVTSRRGAAVHDSVLTVR